MSTDLMPFAYADTAVRVVMIDGGPWFVSAEILVLLDLSRSSIVSLDDDEKGVHTVDTPGGPQQVSIISESGLYSLILRSRKPEAKAIKRWITHEVLPQIRHTGTYQTPAALPGPRELAQMVIDAEDRAEREAAARLEAEHRADALAGPAAAWDALADAAGDYSVADAAKILSRDPNVTIGRDRLFEFMQSKRWIYRDHGQNGRWRAFQSQVDCGRLCEKAGMCYRSNNTGRMFLPDPTIRVTVKGLAELLKRLGGGQQLALVASA